MAWSHLQPVRHKCWMMIFPWIVNGDSRPSGSKNPITQLSTIRLVGLFPSFRYFISSSRCITAKANSSISGSHRTPSTRSLGVCLSWFSNTGLIGFSSPRAVSTSGELDTQLRISKPPCLWTWLTCFARLTASSTVSTLSK
uniref:(northern house mosquito) hypothetical protein n=1 Tax=Culex pipiens TaxID=7175 RepID=A0A8D8EQT8_CULPI